MPGAAVTRGRLPRSSRHEYSHLRRNLTWSWVAGVVIFTVARFFVARGALAAYDIDIWVFGIIDLLTAIPYAVGVAKVVGAMVDRDLRSASGWAVVAAAAFLAPYGYIALAGKDAEVPGAVYVVLALLIGVFGLNAAWGVSRRVRAERALEVSQDEMEALPGSV